MNETLILLTSGCMFTSLPLDVTINLYSFLCVQAAFGHYSKDLNVFKMLETAYLFRGTAMDYDSTRRTPPESFDPKNLNYSSVSYTFSNVFVHICVSYDCSLLWYDILFAYCSYMLWHIATQKWIIHSFVAHFQQSKQTYQSQSVFLLQINRFLTA